MSNESLDEKIKELEIAVRELKLGFITLEHNIAVIMGTVLNACKEEDKKEQK
jgi:hypothetical protein